MALLCFAFKDAMVVGEAARKAEEVVTSCRIFWDSRRTASYAICVVRTVPALQFLLEQPPQPHFGEPASQLLPAETANGLSAFARRVILFGLLAAAALQAIYFQSVFRREGAERLCI